MIGKTLALSPSERVQVPPRLVRFALAVALPSAVLWLAYALVWAAVASPTPAGAIPPFRTGFVLATCGILSTQVAAVGMRYLHWRRRFGPVRYGVALLWVLGVSTIWWYGISLMLSVVGMAQAVGGPSVLARAWLEVSLATGIHYLSYAARRLVSPKLRLDWPPRRGSSAFHAYPKGLSIRDPGDIFEIIDSLNGLAEAYRESPGRGARALDLLKHHLTVSSDPRYNLPMPLPIAVEFLRRELELRRETGGWAGMMRVDAPELFPPDLVVEPAVLHAVGVFAAEYAQYHKQGDIVLRVRFRDSPLPCVEIGTNTRGGDLWFVVAESSAAQGAKNLLVDTLNRLGASGIPYESGQDADGNLVFRVFARSGEATQVSWEDVERTLGQDALLMATCTRSEGSSRVYASGNRVYKVQLIDRTTPKPLTLAEEYNILWRLEGIEGVPQSPSYAEYASFAVLSYERIGGQPIAEYLLGRNFQRSAWFHCLSELSSLLNRIHKRGVIHRDLRPDNVLVGDGGSIALIDFDQAVAGAYDARQVDIYGEPHGNIPPCFSVPRLIDELNLNEEYHNVTEELGEAWRKAARSDASSPGRNIAYYRWVFGHTDLPGERDWCGRWDLMYSALRNVLLGARVLDLGCNLGLVATHCMLRGAQSVTAVDIYDDILDAGRMLASAAGVEVDFVKGDLNSPDFVDWLLGREYDVVLALSVAHWIENRDQAARILTAARVLLFEGHSPASEEAAQLRGLGFPRVQLVGYSERLRALYLASRDPGQTQLSPVRNR